MTTPTVPPQPQSPPRLRRALRGSLILIVLLVGLAFVRFPLVAEPVSPLPYIALAAVAALFTGAGAWAGLRGCLPRDAAGALALRYGLAAGLGLSLVWATYILFTHLGLDLAQKATIGSTLTGLTFLLTMIVLVGAGAASAYRTRQLRAGIVTGLWAGLITGLVCFLVILAMLEVFMGALVNLMNPGELQAYAHSGWHNQAVWYFWEEEFYGSIVYFPLQVGLGLSGGLLGAVAGRLLARLRLAAPPR